MVELLLIEVTALPAERSRGRHNPRVVKRKMSGFPTKARAAPAPSRSGAEPGGPLLWGPHIRVGAPAGAPARRAPPPAAAPKARPKSRPEEISERSRRRAPWSEHVRAWRASGLSRRAYCERHRLDPYAFHQWVARSRQTFRRKGRPPASQP
jgi:hypothetical protein